MRVTDSRGTSTKEARSAQLRIDQPPPRTYATVAASLPERFGYRVKRLLLGPPLVTDQLGGQRLGKPTALAVLSSDVMSSSAYASEEILRVLVPIGGLVAFSLVTPITGAILAVLAVVTICYRDVVRSYPKAGGSYVVSRDNFGPNVAQVAGAALLISYTITVAVSVAAGTDAIISAVPALSGAQVPMSIAFVVLLAYGNLRGIREAGRVFAIPTYFFIANMAVLIVVGLVRAASGDLGHANRSSEHPWSRPFERRTDPRHLGVLSPSGVRQRKFGDDRNRSDLQRGERLQGSAGAKRPDHPRAHEHDPRNDVPRGVRPRRAHALGAVCLGHADGGRHHREGRLRDWRAGNALFYCLQAATALILILAANTSFTGFPFLVSFVAEDSFLPRMLTVRGHRLVFSNGIMVLAAASVALLLATGARVASLIPMYAIGVFTGFTMAAAGMVKHHLTHRDAHWRKSVAVNAIAAVVCPVVVVVFAVAEFTQGAWAVVVVMPILVYALVRTNRQYRTEDIVLGRGCRCRGLRGPGTASPRRGRAHRPHRSRYCKSRPISRGRSCPTRSGRSISTSTTSAPSV